ncbi:helix-turn-helix protein [Flavobacterium cauense R2A-7]|uniref:Helix-turn-helix protein n=1 Tax=Flavobacterium cauense R2A-7 TaxID=1341154 RepID=A0A562LZ78_9FLAO|nr:helix-turn-helix domain-containing protein [Flavobacterium cauense]TWI12853.1 helix-turn-helix protein [Flavobacterium cauense R2A-7]
MRFFFFLVFLMLPFSVYSQEDKGAYDEKILALQEKIKTSFNVNIDSVLVYASELETIDENPLHKTFALASKAYYFQLKSDRPSSDKSYAAALTYLRKAPSSKEKVKINAFMLNVGGLIDWKRRNYKLALDKYEKGIRLSQSIGDFMQVIKFKNNIAMINDEVGNYKQAIDISRGVSAMLDGLKYKYTDEQFIRDKGNVYINLGNFYEGEYYTHNDTRKFYLLDSAEYFYKKAITYSAKFTDRKISCEINLGNIYFMKEEYAAAEKVYYSLMLLTKNNGYDDEYYNVNLNLGSLYFTQKKYDKALACFMKVDSIYKIRKTGDLEFIKSNYYQAKIYNEKNDAANAYKYSEIYLDAFEKNESKITKEALDVNYTMGLSDLNKEMNGIQNKYRNRILLKNGLIGFTVVLFIVLLFVLFRNIKRRREIEVKISALIAEHKANLEKKINGVEDVLLSNDTQTTVAIEKNKPAALSIDEEKENEIVSKLLQLEKKQYYLNPDFTLQSIAKKIKTNTTYLSYVVNKRFGKTFSEYANELKINYVIDEMISNSTYRKYSTQAMAESVGYKNAVSFTKSFSKRTGVTPIRFIKKIEEEMIVKSSSDT